jgi:ABC-type transport system substrate-binding protein
VTARNFVYAIRRALSPELNSPAGPFLRDPNGAYVTGCRAKGRRLIIELAKPDGSFLSKLTMPFFQATSRKLLLTHEVKSIRSIRQMPTAGPYAWARVVPDRLWVLKRNPFYKRGTAGHRRPQNLNDARVTWNVPEEDGYRKTLKNQYDLGPLPAAHVQEVARRFGVNESRFRVKALPGIGFIAFNNSRGLFHDNVAMRKAVNWALDGTDYIAPLGSPVDASPSARIPGFGYEEEATAVRDQIQHRKGAEACGRALQERQDRRHLPELEPGASRQARPLSPGLQGGEHHAQAVARFLAGVGHVFI